MDRIWSRNHGSTFVAAWTSSTVRPRRSRASSWVMRAGVPTAAAAISASSSSSSNAASAGSPFRPRRPFSSDRMPFCSDSGKVRPMAMTSPTDCIEVPSTPEVPGNFSNAQRGILVTT